jgi:hypothetical protein
MAELIASFSALSLLHYVIAWVSTPSGVRYGQLTMRPSGTARQVKPVGYLSLVEMPAGTLVGFVETGSKEQNNTLGLYPDPRVTIKLDKPLVK